MDIETFREYCLQMKAVTEDFPFGPETLVFKVADKVFALCGLDRPNFTVNLKYDSELIIDLREEYDDIQPGYHMNKNHWNTVNFEGKLPERFLKELIQHSYDQVVKCLTKKKREEFSL
jgi:predicted DNA-binding protein (MmcQ/YjbR family)